MTVGPNHRVIPAKAGIHPEISGLAVSGRDHRMDPGLRRDDTVGVVNMGYKQ